jgi:hypothetical protein
MMPHKNYKKDQFHSKVQELKGRFEVGATASLFLEDAE